MASLAQGDFGQSFYYRTPVLELYFQRLPNSLLLAAVAIQFALNAVKTLRETGF